MKYRNQKKSVILSVTTTLIVMIVLVLVLLTILLNSSLLCPLAKLFLPLLRSRFSYWITGSCFSRSGTTILVGLIWNWGLPTLRWSNWRPGEMFSSCKSSLMANSKFCCLILFYFVPPEDLLSLLLERLESRWPEKNSSASESFCELCIWNLLCSSDAPNETLCKCGSPSTLSWTIWGVVPGSQKSGDEKDPLEAREIWGSSWIFCNRLFRVYTGFTSLTSSLSLGSFCSKGHLSLPRSLRFSLLQSFLSF